MFYAKKDNKKIIMNLFIVYQVKKLIKIDTKMEIQQKYLNIYTSEINK